MTSSGWYQLLDIYKDAVREVQRDYEEPLVACPNDGEPLTMGPDGELFCAFDGWGPNRQIVDTTE